MRSIMSNRAAIGDKFRKQGCRLHSVFNCRLCPYDGTYSLDIQNPDHQEVISDFLAKSRKRNYREEIYERIYNKRRFIRRIRGQQSRDDRRRDDRSAVAAEEVVVLSSDDDDVMIAPAPPQLLNADGNQLTSELGTVQAVSGYNRALPNHPPAITGSLAENVPSVSKNHASAAKSPSRTRLGITMPADNRGTMTASVSCISAGRNRVTYVSAPGMAESGVTTSVRHASLRAKNSGGAPEALTPAPNPPSLPGSTHRGTTSPARTSAVNQAVPRTRITNYSAHRLSLSNPSTSSSLSSGMGSGSSRRMTSQCKADPIEVPDAVEVQGKTPALIPRQIPITVPNAMSHISAAMSSTRVEPTVGKLLPSFRIVRPFSSHNQHASGDTIRKNLQVTSNNFIPLMTPSLLPTTEQHKSQETANNSGLAVTSENTTAEVQTRASDRTMEVLPATCYHHSKGLLQNRLCSTKCSEGRCYIIKCRSKNCSRFVLGTNEDGKIGEKHSLVRVRTSPARNFQPWRQNETSSLPKQISFNKCLRFPVQREPTTSSFMQSSSSQSKDAFRILINNSAAESSQKNRRKRALIGQSVSRPLVLSSSISEIDHSYGRQQPEVIQISESTSLPGGNQEKSTSPQRANSPEVVESTLTRRMKDLSTIAPTKNVEFNSQRFLPGGVPSCSAARLTLAARKTVNSTSVEISNKIDIAGPSVPSNATSSRDFRLNWGINPLRNNALPPTERGRSPIINASGASPYASAIESSTSVANMTKPTELALDETLQSTPLQMSCTSADPAGLTVPVSSSSRESVQEQNTNLQPDQPLPPFESINGKFHSRGIKRYWAEPTPPALFDEAQSQSDEPNISSVQKIYEWLVNSTSDSLLHVPMSLSIAGENSTSAGPFPPATRNYDIHKAGADVRNNPHPIVPTPTRRRNRRKCRAPNRKLPLANLKPKIVQGRVTKPLISPSKRRSDDFIVVCEGRGFKVKSSILEQASPVFKEFATKCCTWISINEEEYRIFEVQGVNHWAMYELLKFISCHSYNRNVMRTSNMMRVLDMLKIKYVQRKTFVFPV